MSKLHYPFLSIRMSINYGMDILFGWYSSFIWGVWYFYLGGMVLLFGGYDTSIWGVWYFYLGGMVVLFGGYGTSIWEVW